MEEKTTAQKLKEYKENSKYCWLCKLQGVEKESLFDGCAIQIVGITEEGNVVNPYDNELQGMNAMLPMCAYHMVLSQEGVLAQTTQGQIIQSKALTDLETKTDLELNKLILKLGRAKKDKINDLFRKVAKTLVTARKFQNDMEKEVQKARDKKEEKP